MLFSVVLCILFLPPLQQHFFLVRATGIILQDPGQKRKWVVSYLVINKSRSLRGNWKRLVLDNNLEEGDACLFELIKNKDLLTMIAHISKG